MTRRGWILLTLGAAGCGKNAGRTAVLPPAVEGGWQLKSSEETPVAGAPDYIARLGLRRALQARYDGPTTVEVSAFEMTTGPGAFECMQRWRPSPGKIAAYKDNLFVILTSSDPARGALEKFAHAFEKAL